MYQTFGASKPGGIHWGIFGSPPRISAGWRGGDAHGGRVVTRIGGRSPDLLSESGQDGAEAPKSLHPSANPYDRLYHMWATNRPECSRGCNFTAILIRTASNRSRCPKIGLPDIRKLVKGFFGTMRGAGGSAIQVGGFTMWRPRLYAMRGYCSPYVSTMGSK